MRSDASLARLIKDHGDKWIIEHTGASTAWVGVRIDGDDVRIVGAHDLGGLKYHIERVEGEGAGEQGTG
jgi:hypothetical protein